MSASWLNHYKPSNTDWSWLILQDQRSNAAALSFWMANASELLHFFKQDRDVATLNQDTHDMLAESVQVAFYHLVTCLQQELATVMVAFLDESTEDLSQEDGHVPNRGRPGIGERAAFEPVLAE